MSESLLLFGTAAATAAAGVAVAATAYRGARRNDSATMRWLSVGVVCIAVVPFLLTYGVAPALGLDDAGALLGILLANVAGLLAVLYALDAT
jgi:hypothetical protein